MRSHLLTVAASAGLAAILLTISPANAITVTTPASIRPAADALDLTEAVHCRRYSHRHRHGHRWGRGCGVSLKRSGVVGRDGGGLGTAPRAPLYSVPTVRPNPSNPQDLSGRSNPQDMTVPRAINPQILKR